MNQRKALEGEDLFTGVKLVLQGRKKLAERVANGGGWGKKVRDSILCHEILWITKRQILEPKTGSHSRIISLLEDADTMYAVRVHIQQVGESRFMLKLHSRLIIIVYKLITELQNLLDEG